ncbi:hypothetical protein J132_08868 [Termitomyces sp. J132]|nr:hypothetical protein J132_08868 [Termitomyces sp. J132]
MILEHCSPERVAITLLGECMLITKKDTLPVEGIIMTTTTPPSIPTDTLRSILPSQTTATPYLLFAPQTFGARLLTDADTVTVTFTSPGPFVLSPAFNMTSKTHISILSPHKSAYLVSTANNLPTPPPTPEWMPRSIIPDPRLHEPVSPTPPEIVVVQPAEGGINADDSDTQDGGNTNDEMVRSFPRLCLRAVTLPARYLLSVALFFLTPVVRLIFGKSTPGDDQSAEDTVAIDVQDNGASDIVNDSDSAHAGADVNANYGKDSESGAHENALRDIIARSLASDGTAGIDIPRPELEMLESCPKVLLVEVDEGGTVRLAVWEGETCGVVNAEMNGKRVPVSRRMDDSAQTRVEFWELAVDAGGTLRISYDEDKTQAC